MAFLLALLAFLPTAASASIPLQVQYFEDQTAKLTVEQIVRDPEAFPWRPVDVQRASFGLSASRFWFRFDVPEDQIRRDKRDPLLLEIPNAYGGLIQFFSTLDRIIVDKQVAGLSVPVSARGHNVLRAGFPVFRLPGYRDPRAQYYVSLDGPMPLALPLTLWEAPDFAEHHWLLTLVEGIFVGCLIVAGVFNAFLACGLRSWVYASYSLFVVTMLLITLSSTGLSQQLLWPESPGWALREMQVIGGLSLLFYAAFVREFIGTARVAPRLDRLLLVLVGVNLARSAWLLFDLNLLVSTIGMAATTACNILVLVIAGFALRAGDRAARYFFFASLLFNLAIIVFLLQSLGLVWFGRVGQAAPFAGTLIEVVLLSLALADRIRSTNVELSVQRAAAVHADKMSALGRMAGEIAHEISNPLAIIHGNAVLIRKEAKIENVRDFAGTIENTANRISKVVKGMRSLSRDTRRDPLQTVPFDGVLQDAVALCAERARLAGVRVDSPAFPGLKVDCRATEVSQVLVNLLNNAIDASGGVTDPWIRVEATRTGDHVEIAVCDGGPGVPREIRSRIQEPFFTTKEAGKGLGLGLSISRTIVEGHGGQLWLDEKAHHTRFVFTVRAG